MQPPTLPTDGLAPKNRILTLRLTTDGFVYTNALHKDFESSRTDDAIEDAILGKLVEERQFVPIDWSRVSTLWSNLIAQHPDLIDPVGEVKVLYPTSHYVVIPSAMSGSQDANWWRLAAPIFTDRDQCYSETYALGDGKPCLAVGCSSTLKGIIQRSFLACQFIPTVLPFIQYILRQSSLQAGLSLGAELAEDGCDLVLCQSGELLRANHYSWPRYRSWQHHLYQVLYFLSKVYLDNSIDHVAPVSIILSDGVAGTNNLVREVLKSLHRQFIAAEWNVINTPTDYWVH